ncbi:MAG: metal-binding protein [Alphaproteobacteria bacterium HGW-Alphaproteobacteria-8]|nr:MAG: metal-binding protein [Alphaproteobacteria bacterium HGW-Alphaproteobacteria-8]
MGAVLHICVTCRAGQPAPEGQACPGARLFAAVAACAAPAGVTVRPVECLSACDHGCSIALTKSGGWAYVYGRMTEADAPEILRGAALYAQTDDGVVPWRARPAIFRKQSLARIPPMERQDV